MKNFKCQKELVEGNIENLKTGKNKIKRINRLGKNAVAEGSGKMAVIIWMRQKWT